MAGTSAPTSTRFRCRGPSASVIRLLRGLVTRRPGSSRLAGGRAHRHVRPAEDGSGPGGHPSLFSGLEKARRGERDRKRDDERGLDGAAQQRRESVAGVALDGERARHAPEQFSALDVVLSRISYVVVATYTALAADLG